MSHSASTVPPFLALFIRVLLYAVASDASEVKESSNVIVNVVPGQVVWDSRLWLDRSSLHLLSPSYFCPILCRWVPDFYNATGRKLSIHCIHTGGQLNFEDGEKTQQACARTGGLNFVFDELIEAEVLRLDMTVALCGGTDIYYVWSKMLPPQAEREAALLELGEYIANSDIDWQSIVPMSRDVFMKSSTGIIGVPMDFDAKLLVHQEKYIHWSMVVTWDEYLSKMRQLSKEDRDGDGEPDKPFCVRSRYLRSHDLLLHIATSVFQVKGITDSVRFDVSSMLPLSNTTAMRSAAEIFKEIMSMANVYDDHQHHLINEEYRSGRCVMTYTYVGDEDPPSTPTTVGSHVVYDRQMRQSVDCTPSTCPNAMKGFNGILINPISPWFVGGWHFAINKLSVRKSHSWEFVNFMQQSFVQFSFILQGFATPWMKHHFNVSRWQMHLDTLKDQHQNKIVRSQRVESIQKFLTEGRDKLTLDTYLTQIEEKAMNANRLALDEAARFRGGNWLKIEETDDNATRRMMNAHNTTQLDAVLQKWWDEMAALVSIDLLAEYRAALKLPLQMSNSICPPGYVFPQVDALYCLPCPKGFAGTNAHGPNNTCEECPVGKYQPQQGALVCEACPERFATATKGAVSKAECSVPGTYLQPMHPYETPVDLYWALDKFNSPDQEEKTTSVELVVVLTWRDDRVGVGLHANEVRLNTEEWKTRNLWIPEYRLKNQISVKTLVDYVSLSKTPLGLGRYEIICERYVSILATVLWPNLDWTMFPFGSQTLNLDMDCEQGDCFCSKCSEGARRLTAGDVPMCASDILQDGSRRLLPSDEQQEMQRRLAAQSSSSTKQNKLTDEIDNKDSSSAASATRGSAGSWPQAWPKESITRSTVGGAWRISIVVKRTSTLYVMRLIFPTITMVIGTLLVFFTEDQYNQLVLSFTSLLIMAVLTDQIKDSVPTHVTELTWLDYFMFSNFAVMAVVTALAVVITACGEKDMESLAAAIDWSICLTVLPYSIITNILMAVVNTSEDVQLLLLVASSIVLVLFLVVLTWKFKQFGAAKEVKNRVSLVAHDFNHHDLHKGASKRWSVQSNEDGNDKSQVYMRSSKRNSVTSNHSDESKTEDATCKNGYEVSAIEHKADAAKCAGFAEMTCETKVIQAI